MRTALRPTALTPLLVVLALVAALVTAGATAATAAPARTAPEAAAEQRLVDEHNRVRADASRGTLRAASDLAEVARAWSDEMARTGTMRHNPSVAQEICCWAAWGENVAWAGPVDAIGGARATADRIMRGWLGSPGHRDNIMSATFTDVGIGVSVADNGRMYATAVFRLPNGSAVPAAPPPPAVRGIDSACPTTRVPLTGFTDVGSSQALAVGCLAWWDIAQGTSARHFSPQDEVSRGQLAAFLARAIEQSGKSLPAAAPAFSDVADSTHADAITKLANADVIGGFADDTFRPHRSVDRAQLASMLVKAAEYRTGQRLPAPTRDWFLDGSGTHGHAINQIADAGWAAGSGDGSYGAAATLERGHLALFVARWLDSLVADHGADLP